MGSLLLARLRRNRRGSAERLKGGDANPGIQILIVEAGTGAARDRLECRRDRRAWIASLRATTPSVAGEHGGPRVVDRRGGAATPDQRKLGARGAEKTGWWKIGDGGIDESHVRRINRFCDLYARLEGDHISIPDQEGPADRGIQLAGNVADLIKALRDQVAG